MSRTAVIIVLACGLACVTFLNVSWWSSRIPFERGPDEAEHHAVYRFVAETGALPTYGEDGFHLSLREGASGRHHRPDEFGQLTCEQAAFAMRQTYLFTPQLPYLVGGRLVRAVAGSSSWRAVRVVNSLWLVVAVLAVFGSGVMLWPERPGVACLCALLFSLWPQMTFIGSYINDDMFAIASSTLAILGVVAIDRRGARTSSLAIFSVGCWLVSSSKYYVLALPLLMVPWWLLGWRNHGRSWDSRVALAGGCGVAAAVPWLVRNLDRYGDLTGLGFIAEEGARFIQQVPDHLRPCSTLLRTAHTTLADLWWRQWLDATIESFWGHFGWVDRPFPAVFHILIAATIVFVVLAIKRHRTEHGIMDGGIMMPWGGSHFIPSGFGLPLLLMLLVLSAYNSLTVDYQAQGRYLLPACAPLLLHLVDDAQAIGSTRWQRAVLVVLVVVFAIENVFASVFVVS